MKRGTACLERKQLGDVKRGAGRIGVSFWVVVPRGWQSDDCKRNLKR